MKAVKKITKKLKNDQEKGARKSLLEELFRDFHANRFQVYKMNFFRGLFFGLGSVLGGTVVIAVIIWVVSLLADSIPFLGDFFKSVELLLEPAQE